ncbi:MAG: hypothetical protein ACYC64_19090, partial [Armatimonadota bacterium]
LPGERTAREGRVTITSIRSNKVRYVENETATTWATVVNKTDATKSGSLVAWMYLDVDTVRLITVASFSIAPGETKVQQFSYNVGPETYGRCVEVQFVDTGNNLLDKWQEYYAVAAEYFRVQQNSYNAQMKNYSVNFWTTFFNQAHYFAQEPTDFGIRPFNAEEYISGQGGYDINRAGRQAEIDYRRNAGIAVTFYQRPEFCGQMGYDEIQKHPEYALYGANGQLAIDPIYFAETPCNPMELASPMEIGPNRIVEKPYLDRQYHPWQHVPVNMAMEDAVVYEANLVREYAETCGFDGCYQDLSMGVWDGYNYDGSVVVPSSEYNQYVDLNARNHHVYSLYTKQNNANFGTWYNWGVECANYYNQNYKFYLGTGESVADPRDTSVIAATDWNNVMILTEAQILSGSVTDTVNSLLRNRDTFVQKLGANVVYGYLSFAVDADEPGDTKWGWPTVNYFLSQIIATQYHLASYFIPSFHPSFQFMTRYSEFLWGRDITALSESEAGNILDVTSSETLLWQNVAYQRNRAGGYDLIVHLVRVPATQTWDINLADEPTPLDGVTVTANIGTSTLQDVQSARPYQYEEEQRPVQTVLQATNQNGLVTVAIPPFRYHTMVVFRVNTTP